MMSPGSSVKYVEQYVIRRATEKYMSAVEADCIVSPLTMHWILRSWGSGISSVVIRVGPTGQNVSSDFARTHWPSDAWKSRAETSLHAVYPRTCSSARSA